MDRFRKRADEIFEKLNAEMARARANTRGLEQFSAVMSVFSQLPDEIAEALREESRRSGHEPVEKN